MKIAVLDKAPVSQVALGIDPDARLLPLKGRVIRRHLVGLVGLPAFLSMLLGAMFAQNNEALARLVEGNLQRRQIRLPAIFGLRLVAAFYRWRKYISSRLTLEFFRTSLQRAPVDRVFLWNGSLMPASILRLAATELGVPVTYFENGFYGGTVQVDNRGINGNNSVVRDPGFYRELPESYARDIDTVFNQRQVKNRATASQTEVSFDNYVFVPMQVPSDMQILDLSPWVKSMTYLYELVYAIAEQHPDLRFVIKEHPSFPLSIQKTVAGHAHITFANAANTRALLEGADAVMLINSTVGMEALTLGKKVITLGTAYYNIDGLVLHGADERALFEAFDRLPDWRPDETLRRKFVCYIHDDYLLHGDLNDADDRLLADITARASSGDRHSLAAGVDA